MLNNIYVTEPFLPPIEYYQSIVAEAYSNKWLTNRGPLVVQLEKDIQAVLGTVSTPLLMNNGTIPIQLAVKLLGIGGEIITTPFSYVATTSSIVWEQSTPVFVDIDPDYLSIDEELITSKITKNTKAILATHVFGNPCDVEKIAMIAKENGLSIIYDAAHCFGVRYKGKSIFDFGDISTCSFHATKVFHCGEGGAAFCNREGLYEEIYYRHNFGHNGPEAFHGLGINGKMSELNAAMGLSVLSFFDYIQEQRREIFNQYTTELNFSNFRTIKFRESLEWNYSYMPIIFNTEEEALHIKKKLNKIDIFPRRYFYPSLNTLPYVRYEQMPNSESIASRILCLPIYVGLKAEDVSRISTCINSN